MKTCAYCGHQNEDAAVACVECGKRFETPPVAGNPLLDPSLSPVIVASFSSLQQAQLLVDRLEAGGLEAVIPEEYAPQVFSGVIPLELMTVRVAAKDLEAAKSILAETPNVTPTEPASEPKDSSGI